MFPNAHSVIYRNEAGEVLGWDNPSNADEWYDPDDYHNYDDPDDWCEEHEQGNCGEDHTDPANRVQSEYKGQS